MLIPSYNCSWLESSILAHIYYKDKKHYGETALSKLVTKRNPDLANGSRGLVQKRDGSVGQDVAENGAGAGKKTKKKAKKSKSAAGKD